MIFGPVPTDKALGAILAHSVPLPEGRLRKGAVLQPADIARLQTAGVLEVTVARLSADDTHEDAAALAVARALVPDPAAQGLRLQAVGTGRVNLHAEVAGVAQICADRILALNAVDPMITVATVPVLHRMAQGEMVATVKIISYGVASAAVARACAAAKGALQMRPAVIEKAVLIQTTVDGEDGEKGYRAIQQRLTALGVQLAPKMLVPHRQHAVTEAIRAVAGAGTGLILILTASATSDPADVAPEALRQAGGQVDRFGMPVDPGNLLFLGRLGKTPVIGLPGCAKSPALNGADWVMERLICGVPVNPDDIAAMGVGGLLKEVPARGRLREAKG